MALLGAEVIFYPTAIGSEPADNEMDSRKHWTRVMQGHSAANIVSRELRVSMSFIAVLLLVACCSRRICASPSLHLPRCLK